MLTSGKFASAILASKPRGVLLANFPLTGLPQPDFADALLTDAHHRLFCTLISLGEALADIQKKRTSWPAVKLYYTCFYALECILAYEEIAKFNFNNTHYIGDPRSGIMRKTGASSHSLNWAVFSSYPRLTRWVFSSDSGSTYERLKEFRVEASYKEPFSDPVVRSEWSRFDPKRIEKSFRGYKEDDQLVYTFLPDHCALAYPSRLAKEAWQLSVTAGHNFSRDQKDHLERIWPFKVEFF